MNQVIINHFGQSPPFETIFSFEARPLFSHPIFDKLESSIGTTKIFETEYSKVFFYAQNLDRSDCIVQSSNHFADLSTMIFLITEDNMLVYLERTTSFEYDKIINFRSTGTDVTSLIQFCVRCVACMSLSDRQRLEKKLTVEFWKIKNSIFSRTSLSRRNLFLFIWRNFLLDLIRVCGDSNSSLQHYIFPGGHARRKESLLDCAIRELAEETGICQVVFQNIVAYINITDQFSGEVYHNIAFFGKTKLSSSDLKLQFRRSSEIAQIHFVKIEEIHTLNCSGFVLTPILINSILKEILHHDD